MQLAFDWRFPKCHPDEPRLYERVRAVFSALQIEAPQSPTTRPLVGARQGRAFTGHRLKSKQIHAVRFTCCDYTPRVYEALERRNGGGVPTHLHWARSLIN